MLKRKGPLEKSLEHALHIDFSSHPKIVIMSDCHRGIGTWADNFLPNRPIYTAALKYYYDQSYTYIELGDGDELWENRQFSDIYTTHREIYRIFEEFLQSDRLFLLFGNHDRIKENSAYVWKDLSACVPFHEALIIHRENRPPIHMLHGYQGDLINDQLWKLSRWLVRYIWRPLELCGVKNPTSAARNHTKIRHIEERFINYSAQSQCILIAGHTHKPALIKTESSTYFNSGSCVHPQAITAIELCENSAVLVKWSICSTKDLGLYVCREILDSKEI